jgi:PAS domain S-box-containing protein
MAVRSSPRILWLALALITLPLVALVAIEADQVFWRRPALRQGHEQVIHTLEVIATAQSLDRAVQSAERGQRGFLLTENPIYLDAYRTGAQQAPGILARLQQLTADNPQQQHRMPDLERQIDFKLGELKSSIIAYDNGGIVPARKIVMNNTGLGAMKEITASIDAVIAAENNLLRQRQEILEDERLDSEHALKVGTALAFIIMLLGIVLVPLAFYGYRRLEHERHLNDQRFLHFVDGVADYSIYLLDKHGNIMTWNAGAERIKGYTFREIVGEHFSRLYTEEDQKAGKPARALETAAREGRFEGQGWHVRKDGSRFLAGTVIRPLRDEDGQISGFAKITRDVTEQMKQRQILQQTRAALAQSQKMEALGQLSSGIAHDFNNLIHVIKNCVDILQRRMPEIDAETVKMFEMIRRNADRAASLTQRLLAFSRTQPLEPKPVNPNRLVVGVSELLRRTVGESVALETVLGGGVWWCMADANQLESAILNLAVNARDAMPNGGKLTIETTNTFLDEAYAAAHFEVKSGQYVMVAISDTGSGMPPEVAAKAFEPFFTTKEVGQGTGLGLSQVYGFIKQSNGHVKIYSEVGAGTTVKLYLPRCGEVPNDADQPQGPRHAVAATANETILLVEDEEDIRKFTAEVLSELGYRVLVAVDANSAMQVLEREPGIELLFTDVGLPNGVNGRQLADEACRRWPALKVLFTTAYTRNAIVHHGRLDSGVEVIVKPFTQAELATKVRKVLDAV